MNTMTRFIDYRRIAPREGGPVGRDRFIGGPPLESMFDGRRWPVE